MWKAKCRDYFGFGEMFCRCSGDVSKNKHGGSSSRVYGMDALVFPLYSALYLISL